MPTPHLTDEKLSAELDRALDEQESTAAESHLQDCADCAARRDLLRATSQAVASLPGEHLPRPLDLGFLRQAQPPGVVLAPRGFVARVIHGRPPVWLPTVAAAAAVLVLAFTLAPRFLPAAGGGSRSTAGVTAGKAPAAPAGATGPSQGSQAQAAPGGDGALKALIPNFLAPQEAARSAVSGPDGSTVTILANPPGSPSGHLTQLVLKLVGGPSGTALAPQGMELFISQGSNQLRLAATLGSSPQLKKGEEMDLTGEWTAGALAGPPAPGAYTLVGRVFLTGGRVIEVTLPFIVSP